jgi:hypothetical protein
MYTVRCGVHCKQFSKQHLYRVHTGSKQIGSSQCLFLRTPWQLVIEFIFSCLLPTMQDIME